MKPIVTGLKFVAIGMFLYAANAENSYEFYEILRWSILGLFSYFSLLSYKEDKTGLIVFFLFGAILFNPFKHPDFEHTTWRIVDYIMAGATMLSIVIDIPFSKIKSTAFELYKNKTTILRETIYLLKTSLVFCFIVVIIASRNYYYMSKHKHVNKIIDEVDISISQLPTNYIWKIYSDAQKIFQVEYKVDADVFLVGVNDTGAFKNIYNGAMQMPPPQYGYKYLINDNVTRNIFTDTSSVNSENSVLLDCLRRDIWYNVPIVDDDDWSDLPVVGKKISWADLEKKTPESKINWDYIEKEASKSILKDVMIFYLIPFREFEMNLLDKYYSTQMSKKISYNINDALVKRSIGYSAESENKSENLKIYLDDLKNESSRLYLKYISLNDRYLPILLLVIGFSYLFRLIFYIVKRKTVKK
jgi:hypothetical protein